MCVCVGGGGACNPSRERGRGDRRRGGASCERTITPGEDESSKFASVKNMTPRNRKTTALPPQEPKNTPKTDLETVNLDSLSEQLLNA